MKEYFKYNKGFVNIDDENLYLTNSGNWQEARNVQEKSSKTIKANNFRKNKISFYFYILLGLGILGTIYQFSKGNSVRLPLVFSGLGFAVYRYLIRETGNRYKIPLSKIKLVSRENDSVTITFLDEQGSETTEVISGVDEKGIRLLEDKFKMN
ncbi:hypothetical protein OX283_010420 [Flavobacterium sp. SUN052]|uniref:hypothetical protein n=1 Tax=Flavobacterium sp. SUN052 TaxID=3002441 RepID=UPI00237D3414|nr:hypothetical protein [Flavobacterium sp. SUN052]MEC4005073.1 hypothetical protein [Flavobacterium sp. SUN052]